MKTINIARKFNDEIYCVSLQIPENISEKFYISGKKYNSDLVFKYNLLIQNMEGANELDIYKSNLSSVMLTSDDVKSIFPTSDLFYRYIGSDLNGKTNRLKNIKDIFDGYKKDYDIEDIMEILHVSKNDALNILKNYKSNGKDYLDGLLEHLQLQWKTDINKMFAKVEELEYQNKQKNIENYQIDIVGSKKEQLNIKDFILSLK
jgi:hypothetical protein